MKKFLVSISALFSLMVLPVAGAVSLNAGEELVLTKNLLDDAYIAGGNVAVEAEVFGDLVVAGGFVEINGNVTEDLLIAGGKVAITGDVGGDVRVIGGEVGIFGNVGDDVVVASGKVDVAKSAVIGGSILATSGVLNIEGEVQEDVRGAVGEISLNGKILGNVDMTVKNHLSISQTTEIGGDLKYSSSLAISVPSNVVRGKVIFTKLAEQAPGFERLAYGLISFSLLQKLFSFLAALLLALLFVMLAPNILIHAAKETGKSALKAFGIGILTMIVAFVVPIVLILTIIGIPFAMIIWSLLIITLFTAKIFTAAWLVGYFYDFKKKLSKSKLFGAITVALLAYYVVGMIPKVGILFNLILFLIGVGAIMLTKKEYVKFLSSKKML